jgi:hypothetical protein
MTSTGTWVFVTAVALVLASAADQASQAFPPVEGYCSQGRVPSDLAVASAVLALGAALSAVHGLVFGRGY